MEKSVLFFCLLSLSFFGQSQTLFTYGKNAVSKNEFETAYNKNKTITADSNKAIREYLDLYIAFKLKVQAAKDLRLDTLSTLKADLESFQNQIEAIYLKDDKMVKKLVDESFDRSQKDIHLIDYFIEIPMGADTSIYYKAISQLHKKLKNNQYKETSTPNEQGVKEIRTDAGFITVFTLPYEYENILYNLKPGMVSEPVRTSDGWHIFSNAGERKAVGQIRVAQILISAPEEFTKERQEAKKMADSIYTLLQKGANFSELAKQYSHDRTTYFNEGILPAFGVGKYEKNFEEKAFSIKKDGEVLSPFETEFGYHILKRISAEPIPTSRTNDSFLEELTQRVSKDERMKLAGRAFLKQVIQHTGMEQKNVDKNTLWEITDSSVLANKIYSIGKMNEETPLLQFNDKSVSKVGDWTLYLRNSTASFQGNPKQSYPALFTEFANHAALNNYKKRLSEFSPEFNFQLQEFRDGNMLFEVMEKEVWNKAAKDSAGLLDFYNKNRQKYTWAESADAFIVSCKNKTIAGKVMQDLKNGRSRETILEVNESLLQFDSGRYELQQIPTDKKETFSVNKITQPIHNDQDGTVTFSKILKLYPANEPRSFEEARGMVISDYQQVLEEKWLAELNKKYPVKINKKTFNSLLK
ncbi:MAG: peptidylprolyl isomerase [Ginsengibacter sp.]